MRGDRTSIGATVDRLMRPSCGSYLLHALAEGRDQRNISEPEKHGLGGEGGPIS